MQMFYSEWYKIIIQYEYSKKTYYCKNVSNWVQTICALVCPRLEPIAFNLRNRKSNELLIYFIKDAYASCDIVKHEIFAHNQ